VRFARIELRYLRGRCGRASGTESLR
jgi:hypothetical protein